MDQRPNVLLGVSAAIYALAGVALLFVPAEILAYFGAPPSTLDSALLQVLGSALFGFGMLNWMSRFTRLGGVYGRPLSAANMAHTGSAGLLLGKMALAGPFSLPLVVAAGLYGVLAVAFGAKFFGAGPAAATEH